MADNRTRYDDFDSLVDRHKALVRRMCWWHASGNSMRCADLMQDCFLALWHYRHTLRADASERQERAWVKLHCRSVFSHSDRREEVETVPLEEGMAVAEESESPRQRLEEMAACLTPYEHRVLELILDGYSIAEIAETLEIKPASVSQLRYRMIEKMRNTI